MFPLHFLIVCKLKEDHSLKCKKILINTNMQHAYQNKNGQTAKSSASHQLKIVELHPKSIMTVLMEQGKDLYGAITDGKIILLIQSAEQDCRRCYIW
jgi:hypothetical protein